MTREEAAYRIENHIAVHRIGLYPHIKIGEALDMAIKELREPERKRGRWIDGDGICTVCGEDKFKDLYADIWADWQPPFCPNCGADMRGEQDD